jgi:hypothetical protein
MMFKISLNISDMNLAPWRVIDETGNSHYFEKITFTCESRTFAEKNKEQDTYRGHLICHGKMTTNKQGSEAVFY